MTFNTLTIEATSATANYSATRSPSTRLAGRIGYKKYADTNLRTTFDRLASKWSAETVNMSSLTEMYANRFYQQIIGMGPPAVPFLLDALIGEPDYWFAALEAITRLDPVPPRDRGNLDAMTYAWIEWGEQQGLC